MIKHIRNKYRLILVLPVLLAFSGCYDMTIQLTGLPANTPPSENIYISGNFNNWDPGDPDYVLRKNSDSIYEVKMPKGAGSIEYKFTRGDWSTVEKDPCGFEIQNRFAMYGKLDIIKDTVRTWNDMPKPDCPSVTIILDSLPSNTPENSALYFASNINDWDPGSRYWMFKQGLDGKYYIEIPQNYVNVIEYKITRGSWWTVECDISGKDIDNRVFTGNPGDEVHIGIQRWKDKEY